MNEHYIQFHLDVSEIAEKLNGILKEYTLVDYHILRDEKTINKYYLIVGINTTKEKHQDKGNIVLL